MVVLIPVDASSCLYRFTMPPSYVTGGFVLDVSNVYTAIKTAMVGRTYVTATNLPSTNEFRLASISPNDFASGKFVIMAYRVAIASGLLQEVSAGTNLSGVTVEILIFGDRP